MQENFNREIKKDFEYEFEIEEEGLHIIEIIASCKSWRQNTVSFRGFFNGDDLAVKINSVEFPKLSGKKGLFGGEAAWNGNNLKGLEKTGIFVVNLTKGKHKISFIRDRKPYMRSLKIIRVEEEDVLEYIPENNRAQDGNNRQWITVVLVDLPLKGISVFAKAEKRKRDSDDIKLIIDGEIQKNSDSEKFKNWYWCGSLLGGGEKEFKKDLNFSEGLHYIEFWADRTPMLSKIRLDFKGSNEQEEENKEDSKPENKKRIPTVDDPKWTGDFNDDTEQMILARAIFGEARNEILSNKARIAVGWAIRNRVDNPRRWGNSYKEAILEKNQYSAFREGDPNLPYVKNPLFENNPVDKRAWENCYKIAGQVISGEVQDPADGSNHYYDESINAPSWLTKKNFKIKIDTLFFHRL